MEPIPLRDDGMTLDGRNPMVVALIGLLEEERADNAAMAEAMKELRKMWPEISRDRDWVKSWEETSEDVKRAICRRILIK